MKKKALWLVPLLLVAALVGWRFSVEAKAEAEQKQQQGQRRNMTPSVELARVTGREIVAGLEAVGTLESPYRVEISPKSSGRIEFLEAREGDAVKPGQVLVRVDPSEIQAQVLQQQATVAQARSRLAEAQLGRAPAEVNVAGQIAQQRAGLTGAQADLNQVQANYSSQVAAAQAGARDAEAQVREAQAGVRNAEAEVTRAQASLRNAETRFNRIESLYRQGFIAAQEVDDARTEVDVQRGAVEVARSRVAAAQAAVASSRAQLRSAQEQAEIVTRKGHADIAASRAKVTQSRAGLSIASANRAQNPAYGQNLAALRASVQAAQAQLNQARARLGETVLRSPIRGTVTSRTADPGALATPGQPVLVVQFLDWLYVTASLPVDRAGEIYPGRMAEIRFDALPGEVFRGKVTNVNPAADIANRQFGIRVKLPNSSGRLKPGMYGRVSIVTRRTVAEVVVPREAVKTTPAGKSTVTVVAEDGTAKVREVTLGVSDPKGVQVLTGLRRGEQVVVLAYQPVREGQKVRLPGPGGGEGGRGRGGQGRGGQGGGEGKTR